MAEFEAVSAFPTFTEASSTASRYRNRTASSIRTMVRIATLCLFAYWLAIFTATHLPSGSLPKLSWSDKAYHAIAFAGLSFLLAWAIPRRASWASHLTFSMSIAVVYGAMDELTQSFIPGRHCDWWDFVADACGACLGLMFYLAMRGSLMQLAWGRNLILRLSR